MKCPGAIAVMIVISATLGASAQPLPANDTPPSANDLHRAPKFVTMAALANMYEIGAAQVARQRSANPQVKALAARVIEDHRKMTKELKSIVQSEEGNSQAGPDSAKNLNSLILPDSIDNPHRQLIDKLKSASGQQFDRMYINQQVTAHKEALLQFQSFSKYGKDPKLKDWAKRTEPILESHLRAAEKLQAAARAS
jgi:putative membrane protein